MLQQLRQVVYKNKGSFVNINFKTTLCSSDRLSFQKCLILFSHHTIPYITEKEYLPFDS